MRNEPGRRMTSEIPSLFGYLLYELGGVLAFIAPVWFSYMITKWIADLNFVLNRRSRRAVIVNLRHVLGQSASESEIRSVARKSFRNFGLFIVDFLRFPRLSARSIESLVDTRALNAVKDGPCRKGGVVFLGAHIGNWELGGAILTQAGFEISAVAMPHRNRLIDRFFVKRRAAKGIGVVSREHTTSELLGSLRRNGCAAILGDRTVLGRGAEWKFFGAPAPMPTGHVVLSLRTGAPIVPVSVIREKGSRFKLLVDEPIWPGEGDGAFSELMERCLRVIEKYVRMYPDQWFAFEPIWRDAS